MSQRTIFWVFIARVFLFMPFMTVAGCLPLLIEEWELGAAQASIIASGFFFSYAVSLLAFSWLGDYIGAKRSVILSAWTTAAACTSFALFANDYITSVIFYSMVGLFQGGVYTPLIVLFRENTPRERLGTAIGWLIASTSVGYAGSIGVTGLAIGLSGWKMAFMATGLLPVIGTVLLLLAIRPLTNLVHPRVPGGGFLREIRQNRRARLVLAGYTAHNWELIGMWTWAPALIAASFVLSGETTAVATQWSASFITVLHLGGAFASYTMGRLSDRLGRRTVLIWVAAVAATFSFGIGWFVAFTPYLIAMMVIVYSFFAIGDSPVLSTAVAEWTAPSCLGAMLATRSLIGFVSAGIAPIVVGWVIDALRAGNASDTLVWGMAFATLGLGGLLAVFFATRLPRAA